MFFKSETYINTFSALHNSSSTEYKQRRGRVIKLKLTRGVESSKSACFLISIFFKGEGGKAPHGKQRACFHKEVKHRANGKY